MTEEWNELDPITKERWNQMAHITRVDLSSCGPMIYDYGFPRFIEKMKIIWGYADYKLDVFDRVCNLKIEYLLNDNRDPNSIFEKPVKELYEILINKYLPKDVRTEGKFN